MCVKMRPQPEDQFRLFEPFVQVDNTSTRSFGGTGLGSAICRRLAHALEGEVTVESDFGIGSYRLNYHGHANDDHGRL